jgi:hypothetical protein
MSRREGIEMNVRRGLWRIWIFVTVLWVIGASALAYFLLPENIARKSYSYIYNTRKDPTWMNEQNWPKDLYKVMISPSKEKLTPDFSLGEYQYPSGWDEEVKQGTMISAEFPDKSRLYLSAQLTKEDQNYVSQAFWDQRWKRWGMDALPFVAGAFLPPIVLLILGSFMVWVGRGFARD